MRNKLSCNPMRQEPASSRTAAVFFIWMAACVLLGGSQALAGDAPSWMRSLATATLPAYDEKTDAVLLYSETNVTVVSADKIKRHVREAYKILRPEGRSFGNVTVPFRSPAEKIASLHGWCVPAQGKDFEAKDKEAIDVAFPGVAGGELIDDVKVRVLHIPAPDPGNIVGYEYEIEERPLVLQDIWSFQSRVPARESHYSLQLPQGWEYKASWLNYPEAKPTQGGENHWEWVVTEAKAIRSEERRVGKECRS